MIQVLYQNESGHGYSRVNILYCKPAWAFFFFSFLFFLSFNFNLSESSSQTQTASDVCTLAEMAFEWVKLAGQTFQI